MITNSGAATVKENITRSTRAHLNFYLNALETEVYRVRKQKLDLLADDDLQYLANLTPAMTDYERNSSINRVVRRLALLKESSLYIEEAKVDIPMLGHVISTKYLSDNMDRQERDFLIEKVSKQRLTLYTDGERLLMGEIYPPFLPSKDPIFAIQIQLSIPNIRNTLSQISSGKGRVFLFSNAEEWSVSEYESDLISLSAMREFQERDTAALSSGDFLMDDGRDVFRVFYQKSDSLNATIVYSIPEHEIFGPLLKYRLWLWGLSILSVLIIISSSYWVIGAIHRPMRTMIHAFRRLQQGDLNVQITHRWNDEFQYLYMQFNKMTDRLSMLIQEVYEQKIRKQRAELKQLQSQINPHFLYNSFFLLYRLAKVQDYKNVLNLTEHLSEYFQFITRTSEDDIQLEQEVNHARAYVEIQSMRFKKQLSIQFAELPEVCGSLIVPRLILQPVLENAFQHGLEHKTSDGYLQIRFEIMNEQFMISVEDNGERITDDKLDELRTKLDRNDAEIETTGILNVHRRLRLKFGEFGGLSLSRSHLGGLRVDIRIPYERNE
ncbi:sensor histidine kinase [Paenibacillus prosopidis]|nr:sensor histidine kinase [Paenibacillus prosopidis]